jgi:hypothetical protein
MLNSRGFQRMDWKSTAVISGAGILATWFFSMPPTTRPPTRAPPRAPQSSTSTIDIEKKRRACSAPAQDRIHRAVAQSRFRFSTRREPARATTGERPRHRRRWPSPRRRRSRQASRSTAWPPTMVVANQRTAVLHTDEGVVLAKEGDQVAGYRVAEDSPRTRSSWSSR